ncbi:MAG: tRNA (adenosine(37)-N6)-threonylcarbamoyltransferase complex dimerization subunit type 1 TsaB [Rhodoferax sp.]|nr:tRNA (adenosine(37)-N6)-threonylcarbamoyltransferase complex dimerization subunit type 1 TsaB [Rhodoferax sp.]
MQLLAFDTSTDRMSIAVTRTLEGRRMVWEHAGAGGAQASVALIPSILRLMGQAGIGFADLDAIVFGCGPGAFTGLRTACAVAQGLGYGALGGPGGREIPVLPVDTLLVLAEEARQQLGGGAGTRVLALLDARMNELYSAPFQFDGACWQRLAPDRLCGAQQLEVPLGWQGQEPVLAGNVFDGVGAQLPLSASWRRIGVLPTATALLRLAPGLLAAGQAVAPALAWPTYIRDKVAQTSAERAAAKAALPVLP